MRGLHNAYATMTAALHSEFPVNPGIPQEMAAMLDRLEKQHIEDDRISRTPVDYLKLHKGFWYVATPYAKWAGGHDDAYRHASAVTGRLLAKGVFAFSPIAHSHSLAENAPSLAHGDHSIWMPFDKALVDVAFGLLVVDMPGWRDSKGVTMEINWMREAGKPMYRLDPVDLSFTILE